MERLWICPNPLVKMNQISMNMKLHTYHVSILASFWDLAATCLVATKMEVWSTHKQYTQFSYCNNLEHWNEASFTKAVHVSHWTNEPPTCSKALSVKWVETAFSSPVRCKMCSSRWGGPIQCGLYINFMAKDCWQNLRVVLRQKSMDENKEHQGTGDGNFCVWSRSDLNSNSV